MKHTLDLLRQEAAKLGATVDDAGDLINVDAPAGNLWNSSGTYTLHCLVQNPDTGRFNVAGAVKDLLEYMSDGLAVMTDDDIKREIWDGVIESPEALIDIMPITIGEAREFYRQVISLDECPK